ncbi:MAG: DNA-methyltransferase [Frankiaceae bacterium]
MTSDPALPQAIGDRPLHAWRYARSGPSAPLRAAPAELPRNRILVGDAHEQLRRLPTASVDCCITSPPYYQLRDYGVDGQLGLEPHVDDWVSALHATLREVARVLKPTGALWLNLGDAYSTARRYGAPPKGLLLAPERLVLALAADGWLVRNKVIWAKPNPMPHSVADRLNTAYEVIYLLVRAPRYVFHLDEIREPHRSRPPSRRARQAGKYDGPSRAWTAALTPSRGGLMQAHLEGRAGHVLGKNPGDVWWLPTGSYRGAHFATFPEALVARPLLATCPERLCTACGAPWRRPVTRQVIGTPQEPQRDGPLLRYPARWSVEHALGPLRPSCACTAGWQPGVVLDPFFGSGTVGVVAERLKRDWLGIELNPAYAYLAESRIRAARESEPPPAATARAA